MDDLKPSVFVADTETTNEADYQIDGETRVYLWNVQRVQGLDPAKFHKTECDNKADDYEGDDMASFFEWLEKRKGTTYLWFYNTSFDGAFIVDYGLRHGYTSECYDEIYDRRTGKKEAVKAYLDDNDLPAGSYVPRKYVKKFDTPRRSISVIKSGSKWIMMVIINAKGHVIKVYDVGNKFTTVNGVEGIAKVLGRSGKTDLDVKKRRGLDYIATEDERTRCRVDVDIIEDGIKLFYEWDMRNSTLAGDAWKDYMAMCKAWYEDKARKDGVPEELVEKKGRKMLEAVYPENMPEKFVAANGVEIDVRDAYYGGIVFKNKGYVRSCSVIDRNSMHPSSMKFCPMPYGVPVTSVDKPVTDRYIVKFNCTFRIKEGMLPTLQKKKSIRNVDSDWIYEGEDMSLTLCDRDLEWFLKSYDSDFDEREKTYLNFKSKRLPVLGEYVDKWTAEKKMCKKERGKYEKGSDEYSKWDILYYKAKIMQNALYGKFGQDPVKPYQWVGISDKDAVRVYESDVDEGEYFPAYSSKYLPVACFVTCESRHELRSKIELLKDRFAYCDTDSVHIDDEGIEDVRKYLEEIGIKIDGSELGAWDLEEERVEAKYVRAKTYIHRKNGELDVKCAGMPEKLKKQVTWDNFDVGSRYFGKLMPRMRRGGKTLVESWFEIKGR